jgi:hypothetical protein
MQEGVYHDPSYMYPRDDYIDDCIVLCKKFWGVVDKSKCSVKNFQRDWIQYAGRCCRDRGTCHVGSVRASHLAFLDLELARDRMATHGRVSTAHSQLRVRRWRRRS